MLAVIGDWISRNPFKAALVVAIAGLLLYKGQAEFWKWRAGSADMRAGVAEQSLKQSRKREKALNELDAKQRKDMEAIDNLIRDRAYFDTIDRM